MLEPALHVGDTALQSADKGFIGQSGANDCLHYLVQVGQPFYGIGQGLLVDIGFGGADTLADSAIARGGKLNWSIALLR